MTIAATCDSCFRTYQLKEKLAGRKVRCKECGEVFTVPKPGAAPAADPWETEDPFDEDPFVDGPAAPPPPRPAKKRKKRRKKKSRRRESSGSTMWWVIGIGSVVFGGLFVMMCVVGIFWRPMWQVMAIGMWLTGAGMTLVGGIGLIMAAFEEDTIVGVMYLVVPFYKLYFIITRIGDVWKLVLLNLGGVLLFVAAMILSGMAEAMDDANGRVQQGAPGGEGGAAYSPS